MEMSLGLKEEGGRRAGGDGEQREAYWGQQRALLSVISIQMCRIRCRECCAAQGWKLVLFLTQPWSRQGQIQTNEFTQTIHMECWRCRGMYERQKRRRGVKQKRSLCLTTLSLSFLWIINNCQHIFRQLQGDFHIPFKVNVHLWSSLHLAWSYHVHHCCFRVYNAFKVYKWPLITKPQVTEQCPGGRLRWPA